MQTKRNIWTACLMMCLLILTGFGFNSCEKEQIDTKVILNSFGPSPALRGGELRFIGNNLEKVTSIILPGLKEGQTVEVTEITVIDEREIRITIPQDAGVGLLTLKTPEGDITTITPLTYSEPISIESVTPATIKAGQTLTITGDYLNLIKSVIFFDGIAVGDTAFVSQTRKKIEVKVPAEAQTGKIILSNGAEIPIEVYSKDPLNIVLPTFTSFTPTTIKPGAVLTITGKDLDLVSMVEFGGGKIIPAFTLSSDGTKITITVPEDAQEGIIKLIAKSGVYVEGIADLKLVMPSNLAVEPAKIKNNQAMTITGTNLDLVSAVMFGDLEAVISEKSATKIILTVPETASATAAKLVTLSTKTVDTPEFTYVTPTITSIAPLALMAGNNITINGTDLDLVRQVKFVGGLTVDVTPATATSFEVTVPPACVGSDVVTLITTNGTEIASTDQLVVEAANKPVVTKINASVKPGAKLTIEGTKLHLVEAIYFQTDVKAVLYGVRTETSIEVFVPETAKKGAVTLKLVAYNGDEVVSPVFNISGTDPVTDESLVIFDFENRGGDNSANNAGDWGGIANGKSTAGDGISGDFFEITASNWNSGAYWWVADNWVEKPYPTISGINNYVIKMDIRLRQDIPVDEQLNISLRMSDNKNINIIPSFPVENNKYSTGGEWVTITIPTTGLQDPTVGSGDWGIVKNWNPNNVNFTGLCVDNIRFDLIQ